MKLGTRDFKAKSGLDSGLKVCTGDGMTKIILGVTVSVGLWVGITGTNWGPTNFAFKIIDKVIEPS